MLYLVLFHTLYIGKAPRGGDAVMGYAWGIIILNVIFAGCMLLVGAIIGAQGGFGWVGSSGTSRFLLVAGGLVAALFGTAITSLLKGEPGAFAGVFRFLGAFVPALMPALLLTGFAILLNDGLQTAISPAVYRGILTLATALGALSTGLAILTFIAESNRNAAARLQSDIEFSDRNHQRMLDEIDSCDVQKNMVFILVFTDANQSADVRERALAKIKTRPDWQEELLRRLRNDWAPEAFNFLASNPVDNPDMFPEAIREGVLIQARLIRESIRSSSHPSHFYADRFRWEVERVLRTVDRYEGMGVDFRPAVRELRAALNEPSEYNKVKLGCAGLLDTWLQQHQ